MNARLFLQHQRGVVLIVVLWVLALLMLLLVAFGSSVRVDRQVSAEITQRAQGRAGTDAVLAYLASMKKLGEDTWSPLPGQVFTLPGVSGVVRFRLLPEEAFVSLSGASPELLGRVIGQLASGDSDAALAVASLVERRQAPPASANGEPAPAAEPLRAIDELLSLPGFDRDLVDRLAPLSTLDSEHTGISVRFAARPLLQAIAGDARLADELAASQGQGELDTSSLDPAFLSPDTGELFRLQVEVGEGRQRRKIEVTVSFGGEDKGYRVVRWNEYTARFSLDGPS